MSLRRFALAAILLIGVTAAVICLVTRPGHTARALSEFEMEATVGAQTPANGCKETTNNTDCTQQSRSCDCAQSTTSVVNCSSGNTEQTYSGNSYTTAKNNQPMGDPNTTATSTPDVWCYTNKTCVGGPGNPPVAMAVCVSGQNMCQTEETSTYCKTCGPSTGAGTVVNKPQSKCQ